MSTQIAVLYAMCSSKWIVLAYIIYNFYLKIRVFVGDKSNLIWTLNVHHLPLQYKSYN